mmetsp:Transcript_2525/g.3343  ORF Transcript_2525/g.3343 Transcript_2525/m.3343 type:complete len:214 (-) Transcript_2525:398-1039(-)
MLFPTEYLKKRGFSQSSWPLAECTFATMTGTVESKDKSGLCGVRQTIKCSSISIILASLSPNFTITLSALSENPDPRIQTSVSSHEGALLGSIPFSFGLLKAFFFFVEMTWNGIVTICSSYRVLSMVYVTVNNSLNLFFPEVSRIFKANSALLFASLPCVVIAFFFTPSSSTDCLGSSIGSPFACTSLTDTTESFMGFRGSPSCTTTNGLGST